MAHLYSRNPNLEAPLVRFKILGRSFLGLFDTCCKISLAGHHLVNHLRFNDCRTKRTPIRDAIPLSQRNPGGEITKREEAWVYVNWETGTVRTRLIYVPELISDLILGNDFMVNSRVSINFSHNGYELEWNPGKVYPFEKECSSSVPLTCWKTFYIRYDAPPPRKTANNPKADQCSDKVTPENAPKEKCQWNGEGADVSFDEDANLNDEENPETQESGLQSMESLDSKISLENKEKLLLEESKRLLKEYNRFHDLLDSHLFSDLKKWEMKEFCKELLQKFHQVRRELSKN